MVVSRRDLRLVIGIDFGTTFSGGAWAEASAPDHTHIVTGWPLGSARVGGDLYKAPTQISFSVAPETASNTLAPPKWGFSIPPTATPLKWFKLLLLDDDDVPASVRGSAQLAEAQQLLEKEGKTAMEAVSSYLKELWEHILKDIKRSIGPDLFNILALEVVITLPAIWPHYAQARMREAARTAGILNDRVAGATALNFISEPEAAAIATFNDNIANRPNVDAGDHFVVCDAGGGTVDIITYEVTNESPLSVRESIQGDGKLCGAVFLDEAFVRLVKDKVGHEKWSRYRPDAVKKFLSREWDGNIKKVFDGESEDDGAGWSVQLPPDPVPSGFSMLELDLTREDLISVFDPVSNEVESLVVDQVQKVRDKYNKVPRYIMLVGGFGRCRYLYSKLQNSEALSASLEGITILQSQGDRPWTAICRGAVLRGLMMNAELPDAVHVESRVTRASYGVRCQRRFNPSTDDESKKYWCAMDCTFKVRTVEWFLEIGNNISEREPVSHSFYGLHNQTARALNDSITIVYSTEPEPPRYIDESCRKLCRITWKNNDLSRFSLWTNPRGKVFRKVWTDVRLVSGSASVDFEVVVQNERVAMQNVAVMYEYE